MTPEENGPASDGSLLARPWCGLASVQASDHPAPSTDGEHHEQGFDHIRRRQRDAGHCFAGHAIVTDGSRSSYRGHASPTGRGFSSERTVDPCCPILEAGAGGTAGSPPQGRHRCQDGDRAEEAADGQGRVDRPARGGDQLAGPFGARLPLGGGEEKARAQSGERDRQGWPAPYRVIDSKGDVAGEPG